MERDELYRRAVKAKRLNEELYDANAIMQQYKTGLIGICYEGNFDEKGRNADTRTLAQRAVLIAFLRSLKVDYPDAEIIGHCELKMSIKIDPTSCVRNIMINSTICNSASISLGRKGFTLTSVSSFYTKPKFHRFRCQIQSLVYPTL